jgi:hypothetical protein
MVQEAGFDVSKADWLRHQAKQTLELSDSELESVAGGTVLQIGLGVAISLGLDCINRVLMRKGSD